MVRMPGNFWLATSFMRLMNGDGVEIFAAAELIGDPFARSAGIVKIEHGGDGVHAEAVDVVFVEPEECIGD